MDDQQIATLAAADPTNNDWGQGVDPGERKIAHRLDLSHGNAGFSAKYYGAWHDLGVVFKDDSVTALQLLQGAGGDYPIFSAPVSARVDMPIGPGSPITMPVDVVDPDGRINVMRLHPVTGIPEILGQASKSYPLWSNRDIFLGYADQIIDAAEPTASTCVVLDGGRRTVMSFELPKGIAVGGMTDESVRVWVVVITSYDQSTPTITYLTTIRPVCANTVRAGRAQAFAKYVVRKTKNADLKVQMAREALALVPEFTAAAAAEWEDLLSVQVTNQKFEQIVTGLYGPGDEPARGAQAIWDKKFEKIMNYFTTASTTANVRNTGYGAVQALTEFADWDMRIKIPAGMTEQGARLWRSISELASGDPQKRSITSVKVDITDRVLALL